MPRKRRGVGRVSPIRGPEVLSEEDVRERGRVVGTIKQTFEPMGGKVPRKRLSRKVLPRKKFSKRDKIAVREAQISGEKIKIGKTWVNREEFETNPKYAHLRDQVGMYRVYTGWKSKLGTPPDRLSIVPYDSKFAEEQKRRAREPTPEEKRIGRMNRMFDKVRIAARMSKETVGRRVGGVGESEGLRRIGEKGLKSAAVVKSAFERKSREIEKAERGEAEEELEEEEVEEKEKKKKAEKKKGAKPKKEDITAGDIFNILVFLFVLMLIIILLSWITRIF